MIRALHLKNKTYLSLSTANERDFIAIMTDHYNYIDDKIQSQSLQYEEQYSDSVSTPRTEAYQLPSKRKVRVYDSPKPSQARKVVKKYDNYEQISKPAENRLLQQGRKRTVTP